MPMYKNVASKKIIIAGASGNLVEINPGQSIDLPDHIARKAFPHLQLESVQAQPQILTEAPAPLEQVSDKVEEPIKKKSTKKKKGA